MKINLGGSGFAAALAAGLTLLIPNVAFCAKIGDTLEQVLAEKGPAKNQIDAGEIRVLTYADAKIKLKSDVVVSVTPIASTATPTPIPAKTSEAAVETPPAQNKAAALLAERKLRRAIEIVQNIVNQPPEATPIKPGMRVTNYGELWFHPGATRPDFAHVDVRATQELSYSKFPYVTSNLNPGVAFDGAGLEFNSMLKFFYLDRTLPKKKLTEREMLEINQQYRVIAECQAQLAVPTQKN